MTRKTIKLKVLSCPDLVASNDSNRVGGIYDIANNRIFLPESAYKKLCKTLDKDPEDKTIKISIKVDYDNDIKRPKMINEMNKYSNIVKIIKEYINRK